jgi:hypothetical protein
MIDLIRELERRVAALEVAQGGRREARSPTPAAPRVRFVRGTLVGALARDAQTTLTVTQPVDPDATPIEWEETEEVLPIREPTLLSASKSPIAAGTVAIGLHDRGRAFSLDFDCDS